MFKHLFALLLLVAATVSATPPAHASTLTVNSVQCYNNGGGGLNAGYYVCNASVSGGTGTYTSFAWWIRPMHHSTWSYVTTTQYPQLNDWCSAGTNFALTVTVTDSAEATASGLTSFSCRSWAD